MALNWFRFQEVLYTGSKLMLRMDSYLVLKETKAGVWIDLFGRKRFVLRAAKKRYACPTIEEALTSYHARKSRQCCILRHRLAMAEAALKLERADETTYFGVEDYVV